MKKKFMLRGNIKFRYLVVIFALVVVSLCYCLGDRSEAANDLTITCDGEILNSATVYQMKSKEVTLILGSEDSPIYADKNLYRVEWTIETGKDIAEVTPGSSQIYGIVKAKEPGEVTVLATVYSATDTGTVIGSVTCKIQVVFSIDTSTDDNVFKYPYEDSEDKGIFLRVGDRPVPLSLNYGSSDNAQWTIANTEIAEVSENGVVTPVGAGFTKITSTYTPPDSPDTTYTTTIDVYVYPQVNNVDSDYKKNVTFGLDTGELIYTDAIFSNNIEAIQNKMVWVIKKEDGNGGETVIADSLGQKTSELIKISPVSSRSNQLKVDAKAGKYFVYFYPKNAYESEEKCISGDVFAPTVLALSVYAKFDDYQETLPIGSTYDIAEAFNLTQDEFMRYFNVTLTSNSGAASNYATLDESVVTAINKNEGRTTVVTANVTVKDEHKSVIPELLNPSKAELMDRTKFEVELTIADVFSLDQTYMTVYAGQKINLNAYFNNENIAPTNISWSSSDESYAKVSATGEVEAVKVTQQDVVIHASYTPPNSDAKFEATCQVKIIATAANLKISDTNVEMNVGDSLVLSVESNPEVAYPPYIWMVSDPTCLSYTLTADKKTATITALKVPGDGKVTVTVLNPLNEDMQVCNVIINSAYESLELSDESVTMKSGSMYQLHYDYTPDKVTRDKLVWTSLDTNVVTVDEYGTLTAKAPGMTHIMVSPEYNPNGIYVQCVVTVVAGCSEMTLSDNEVTMNTGEERVVKVSLLPKGCMTDLTWNISNESVVSVSYDEETNQATLKGLKAGPAIVTVVSNDGPVAEIAVTVLQPCEALAFSPEAYEMKAGETYDAAKNALKKTPEDTTDEIVWTTYDTTIANVDATGVITAGKTGETFIQATSTSGKVAVIKITVKEGLTSVALDPEKASIEVDQSITLTPKFTPEVAYDKSMTWTVSDSTIAKIEPDGESSVKVTGLKGGFVLVKGESRDGGYVVSCMVTVTEKATSVTVDPASKILQKGKSFKIKATVTSETATNKSVKWSTSKKSVATVSKSGTVKGKKIGTAYIKATAQDGSGASAQCKVRVVRKITKITLNKYKAKVLVGDTLKLKAKIKPKNATIKGLTWSSSDNTIATVDSTGRVHGLAAGLVKIRAKAQDGSGKSAVCLLTVMDPVPATGVDVQNNDLIVAKGRQIQSGIQIAPANSTDKIKYHSDNKRVARINKRGKIYARRVGQATVYGETSNGRTGYADVLVVTMNRKKLTFRQYDTETLRVDEIKEGVTWYSKNPLIASVDQNGKVTGRRKGTTKIYAKVRGLRLPCKVRVTGL